MSNVQSSRSKTGPIKKIVERVKPKNWFKQGHSRTSSPAPSTSTGYPPSVQIGVALSGLQVVDPIVGNSQAQSLASQRSYSSLRSSSSAQAHGLQDRATSAGATAFHSTGSVIHHSETKADPEKPSHTQSTVETFAGAALSFTTMLLKRLPDVMDTNPAKVAFGIVKIILQIKDEVKGNIDAVDQRIISTVDQLRAIEDARHGWKPNSDKELRAVKSFESTLIKEYENLIKLKEQSIMRKIAVHEESKGEIAEIFQRISQAREQLVMMTSLRVHAIVLEIQEDLARSLLKDLQPAHSADHKYELEGEDQSLRRSVCTPGTRVRIRDAITRWANDASSECSSVFWLVGQAGSGKTTIAYTIARRFEFAGDADDKIVLGGNFFCSRQMKETRSATRIVRTIAYHLARRCKAFADALDCTDFDIIHQGVRAQLQKLLIEPWKRVQSSEATKIPHFLVIIDALDEIDGQGGSEFLRDLLDGINKYGLRGLKFFATSRPDPGLVDHLESFPNKQFYHLQQVPMEEAEADITAYLNAELPNLQGTQELKNLVGQAAGLFIYAATVVKYLGKCSPPEQRGRISRLPLSGIPQGRKDTLLLDRLYLQVLQDAFDNFEDDNIDFERRLKIMHTFLCSAEPVSINIVAKLLFPPKDPDFTETISHVLASLHAVLYTQNHMALSYHKSFTDFIFDQNRAERFWCDNQQFHLLLCNSCFRVMDIGLKFNIANIETSFILDQDNPALPDAVKQNIPLVLRYSCFNWGYHLAKTDSHKLVDTLSRFLKLPVLFWVEAMNLIGSRGLCERMLRDVHKLFTNDNSSLADNFGEAASFALHFSGSGAALSTPHLYISSLATWRPRSVLSQGWKIHFPGIPNFVHASAGRSTLMTITIGSEVNAIAISSDNKWIVSGSNDKTVRVWDASTGEELKVLEGHSDMVSSVAFSSDNKWIISGSNDQTVRMWDASMGEELKVLEGHSNWVSSVAFSSNNNWIVSGSYDQTVRVWDASTGEELKVLEGHSSFVLSVSFSSDNKHILSGSRDNTVRVWDASTGKVLKMMEGHSDMVSSVAFSSDNKWIVSSSYDQTVRVWDASTGEELKVLEGHSSFVTSVAFSSDNKWIVSSSYDQTVRVWDASTGEEIKMMEGHSGMVSSVTFLSNSKWIISGSDDHTVRVWDVLTGEELKEPEGHSNWVPSVAFSSDNMWIVSGSYDKTVRVWDTLTGKVLKVLEGHSNSVWSVAFSSNNKWIVSGSYDQTIRVWDALTGEELKVLEGHSYWVLSVAFSSDNKWIVSGSYDKTVRVWDALMGEELKVLEGHSGVVSSVAFSSDNKRIVSGSYDHTVRVWDASTGKVLKVLEGHSFCVSSVAFSSNNNWIVSGSYDQTVRVWDASTGEELKVLEGHSNFVLSVSFSSDNKHILSGSRDNTVRVWDASMGEEMKMMEGHSGMVSSVAFSSDNKWIVSSSYDQTVRVWDASTGEELKVLEGHNNSVSSVPFSSDNEGTVSSLDDETVQVSVSSAQHASLRYVRQKSKASIHTGWLLSTGSDFHYLMFVPLAANLPDSSNILTIPQSRASSVDFTSSSIGPEWSNCFSYM